MTDHTHDQPVIVQTDSGGNGLAMIVGVLLVLALLVGTGTSHSDPAPERPASRTST